MDFHLRLPLSPSYHYYDGLELEDGDMLCGYASKKCMNARTTKKGGGLHRFCEFHRCRANRNQWRVDNKRRAVRAQRRQQLKRLALSATIAVAGATGAASLEPFKGEPAPGLTSEDIVLLQEMLFDDEDSDYCRRGDAVDLNAYGPNTSLGREAALEFVF